jgi:hypothetical protein
MRCVRRILGLPVAFVFLSCCMPLAFADETSNNIYTCTSISHPGSYQVVANITATASNVQTGVILGCIVINTSNVTLDLAGHTITGPPGGFINGAGVAGVEGLSQGLEGIKVLNGVVTGLYDGVLLYGSGHVVENVRSFNNVNIGILVYNAPIGPFGHRVVGNTAVGNGAAGIYVYCPSLVLQNAAAGNGAGQIATNGTGCTLSGNLPAP